MSPVPTPPAPVGPTGTEPAEVWSGVLGRVGEAQALARALAPLAAAGIPAVVLKGALHRHWRLPAPPSRDVDLLVHPERFRDARFALEEEGFGPVAWGSAGVMLGHRALDREVDLHQRPFPIGLFRLGVDGVFLRAAPARVAGCSALVPSPLDAWALVVGHFAKDRRGPAEAARLDVLGALGERFALDAAALAAHLERHGLALAAGAVLPLAAARGDALAGAVLARLPRSAGARRAALAYRVLVRRGPDAPEARLAPHLVNPGWPRAALSALVHGAEALGRRTGHGARLWSVLR